jgi:hypothetical protein
VQPLDAPAVGARNRSVRFTDTLPVAGTVLYGLELSFYRPTGARGAAVQRRRAR